MTVSCGSKISKILACFCLLLLGAVDAPSLGAGLAPAGEVAVHEGVETGVVGGLEQVAELVDNDVLYSPLGEQEQVDGEGDGAGADVAGTPARDGGPIADLRGLYAHELGMVAYEG